MRCSLPVPCGNRKTRFIRLLNLMTVFALLVSGVSVNMAQLGPAKDKQTDVTWQTRVAPAGPHKVGDRVELLFVAQVKPGFHLFSAKPSEMGYRPTEIFLDKELTTGLQTVGPVREQGKLEAKWDDLMEDTLRYYHNTATFRLPVKITAENVEAVAVMRYQYCTDDDGKCFFPNPEFEFAFTAKANTSGARDPAPQSGAPEPATESASADPQAGADSSLATAASPDTAAAEASTEPKADNEPGQTKGAASERASSTTAATAPAKSQKTGMWLLFLQALGGGLVALFTPCVFPMIPLTVSFFTKRASSRAQGVRDAFVYAGSIIFVYVAVGLTLSLTLGADALYQISINPWLNLVFFLLLFVFALSFFGLFELELPSSWSGKIDKRTSKGGFVGIFFMGVTLVLVSFSCTGPIASYLLIEAASAANKWSPTVGMLGFSLAFALPFGLLSVFPSMVGSLPKSGGWLNAVKVVLGFLELALSLKFLSNADLVWKTGLLETQVFLGAWIVISLLTALYLFGGLRLPHDTPLQKIGWPRAVLGALALWFAFYLIPGLWGAPLSFIAGFTPPFNAEGVGVILVDSAGYPGFDSRWWMGLFDREILVGLFLVLSLGLSLWALKRLPVVKWENEIVSVPRLMLALAGLLLFVNLLPGLWGAPLHAFSGILPPPNNDMGVRVLPHVDMGREQGAVCQLADRRYAERLAEDTPPGFCAFYDLDQAADYAQKVGKPLLVDFTGHTCANCRKMEQGVWRKTAIREQITADYVLVSLFVDDRLELDSTYRDPVTGNRVRTLGDKWLNVQERDFAAVAQPYYVLLDPQDLKTPLVEPVGYTPDEEAFQAFLQAGRNQYGQE